MEAVKHTDHQRLVKIISNIEKSQYNYFNYFNALMLNEKSGIITSDTEMVVNGKVIDFTIDSMLCCKDILNYDYLADDELLKQSIKPGNGVDIILVRNTTEDVGIIWVLGGRVVQTGAVFVIAFNILTNEAIENL